MMRNKYGLHNRVALTQREYDETTARSLELATGQVQLPRSRDATPESRPPAPLSGRL